MKTLKNLVTYILVMCLGLPVIPCNFAAAKGIKLSSKSINLYVSGTATSMMNLTITPPNYSEGAVMEMLVAGSITYYAAGIMDISALSQTNTEITYTYTNASTNALKNSLYELGEVDLNLGWISWSLLLKTSGSDLTLKDLGFTSYKI